MKSTEAIRLPPRVETYLTRSGLAEKAVSVVPLTGDASDRKYMRQRGWDLKRSRSASHRNISRNKRD